ncbi:hypothetical protein EXIGLDRAFT_726896 [Exidia glandulosa HHB12029]|uniref:protein-tyrosine-phosphatase n=1 Tax=Exidia glandulosa HHB12029 TaxID=1314781 RepID=A0A165DJA7_EXIGL|nr:hypothetical protein EXIGLDRAFT_726896 [Exidia glandulosa HHB12029]
MTSNGRPTRLAIPSRHSHAPSVDLPLVDSESAPNDPVLEELAKLEQLRKSVRQNLELRPIGTGSPSSSTRARSDSNASSTPSTPGSVYYTPIDEFSPTPFSPAYATPQSSLSPAQDDAGGIHPRELFHGLDLTTRRPLMLDTRPLPAFLAHRVIDSINLSIPSLILKRVKKPGGGFKSLDALRHYITTDAARDIWDNLMRDAGQNDVWDRCVVIFDDEMDERDMSSTAWTLLSVLQPVLAPIHGQVTFLRGGFALVKSLPDLESHLETGDPNPQLVEPPRIALERHPSAGLGGAPQPSAVGSAFILRTDFAQARSTRTLIDHDRTPSPIPSPRPPTPRTPGAPAGLRLDIPAPPPSPGPAALSIAPRPRVPSLKTLSLDTSSLRHRPSAERVGSAHPSIPNPGMPKLSLRMNLGGDDGPASAVRGKGERFPGAPPSMLGPGRSMDGPPQPRGGPLYVPRLAPPSPGALHHERAQSAFPSISTEMTSLNTNFGSTASRFDWGSASSTSSSTDSSSSSNDDDDDYRPPTARPLSTLSTPDSAEMPQQFIISCILPNFLFLGPEVTLPEHVAALEEHGIKRILNIAAECDDDHGLHLRERFDKYMRIPIRDTVEEENIARGVQEVCKFLDDARLHSSATYVHCKAGKSRSVTAVMAYLIHANHWTLSRAYAFVLERRKGISPNIGFVSELMTFEERELGGKSVGVTSLGSSASAAPPPRRPAHIRESLPPQMSDSSVPQYLAAFADSGEDMEVKDPSGRYRHQRRAPVDERTLQPTRRVSKAGLESTDWRDGANSEGSGSDW